MTFRIQHSTVGSSPMPAVQQSPGSPVDTASLCSSPGLLPLSKTHRAKGVHPCFSRSPALLVQPWRNRETGGAIGRFLKF